MISAFVLLVLFSIQSGCSLSQVLLPASATTAALADYETYTVRPGDTLGQIAARHHSTIERLISLNSDRYPALVRDPSQLRVGWRLYVPTLDASEEGTPASEGSYSRFEASECVELTVEGINAARSEAGLVLLRIDPALIRIAEDRSTDMIARNYFSHYDPESGQEALLRNLQATRTVFHYAGENIAEIKNDVSWVPSVLAVAARYSASDLAHEFVRGWLQSPEHRDNILNAHYLRTGVALGVSVDGRRVVASQIFAD